MAKEPYLAHSELTYEIYIVSGRNKYLVTDQAVKAVKAIQTREQEPTDAISRDALKKMLMGLDKWHVKNKQFVNVGLLYDDVFFGIEQLPSVTQKSGKWLNDKDDMPTCSKCGYIPPYSAVIDDYEYSNYCPNCGAKMEIEVNNG